jgi:hypothetical protein
VDAFCGPFPLLGDWAFFVPQSAHSRISGEWAFSWHGGLKMKMDKKTFLTIALAVCLFIPRPAQAFSPLDLIQVGAAFLTNLGVHETGHYVMAHMGGADEVKLDFFTDKGGSFFLGRSTAKGMNREARLSYKLGGEAAVSYLFEAALRQHRFQPTAYNSALLFFSGTDFLWYSIWAFYIGGNDNPGYDPIGISKETGLSAETIFSVALLQTALNSYRVYSASDVVIPFIGLDKKSAKFGVQVRF